MRRDRHSLGQGELAAQSANDLKPSSPASYSSLRVVNPVNPWQKPKTVSVLLDFSQTFEALETFRTEIFGYCSHGYMTYLEAQFLHDYSN